MTGPLTDASAGVQLRAEARAWRLIADRLAAGVTLDGCAHARGKCFPANPSLPFSGPPKYSTDIPSAFAVVAEVQRRLPGWRFCLLGGDQEFGYYWPGGDKTKDAVCDRSRRALFGWRASFFGDDEGDPTRCTGQRHADEHGDTIPLAICKAALAALASQRALPDSPATKTSASLERPAHG